MFNEGYLMENYSEFDEKLDEEIVLEAKNGNVRAGPAGYCKQYD